MRLESAGSGLVIIMYPARGAVKFRTPRACVEGSLGRVSDVPDPRRAPQGVNGNDLCEDFVCFCTIDTGFDSYEMTAKGF